jgi:hypothetical protein
MEQIILNKRDYELISENYPDLTYNKLDNSISGILSFYRSYNDMPILGKYSIEFKLEYGNGSILPKVRETEGKILSMAKRKMESKADFHLSSENGDLCLIFPIKEKEHYPDGFEFMRFLNHLETHLYWVTYYDRYNEKPWKDEPHNSGEALMRAAKENKIYRKELKAMVENKVKRKLSRPEFRRYLKSKDII